MIRKFDIRQYSGLTVGDVQIASNEEREILVGFNWQLIQMSSLRVIFLYGPQAMDIVLSGLGIRQQCRLHIRKLAYEMFVEMLVSLPRLYIVFLELLVTKIRYHGLLGVELMRLLGLRLVSLRKGVFEITTSLARILRHAQDETRGGPVWTVERFDINTKTWLIRKG
jgi:hypothetical protein